MNGPATRHAATAVASALICLSTACTTLTPVTADATGAQIRAEVRVGDTVRVLAADGTTHSFKVSAVGESSLAGDTIGTPQRGTDVAGSRIELPYRDIRQIDVQRIRGLRTIAIVAAVVVVAAIAIATGGGSHTPGYSR